MNGGDLVGLGVYKWAANSRYGMEQRPNHALLKDAQTLLSEEECASRMRRRKSMQQ